MNIISVSVGQSPRRGTVLIVRSPYALHDAMKTISGGWWEPAIKAWTYPHSPVTVETLSTLAAVNGAEFQPTSDAETLLARHREARALCQRYIDNDLIPDVPASKTPSWRHQRLGYHLIRLQPATMLAWEMGAGKTKPIVDYIAWERLQRVLVICPLSVVDVWPREFARHAAADVLVVPLGGGATRGRAKTAANAMARAERGMPVIIVVNYDAVWRGELGTWVKQVHWNMIVCDESHKLKAPGGTASKFISALAVANPQGKRVALTGTPAHHSPLDVYAQYRFLDPGVFGTSYTIFRAQFAVLVGPPGEQWVNGYKNLKELHERFYTIAHRVTKDEVLDLPETVHEVRLVNLGPESARIYRDLEKHFIAEVESGAIVASNALVKLLRLQQLAGGWAALDDGTGKEVGHEKADALADVLDDLPASEPVIVFCRFLHDLDSVVRVAIAADRPIFELSGRRRDLLAWQQHEGSRGAVLAVQIQSGGLGVDFTRARYAVYYSLGFSLGDYEQSLARLHRPGQTRSVTYIHLLATGTIDDTVFAALQARKEIVEAVIDPWKKRNNP